MRKIIEWFKDTELRAEGFIAWFVIICTVIVLVKAIINIVRLNI